MLTIEHGPCATARANTKFPRLRRLLGRLGFPEPRYIVETGMRYIIRLNGQVVEVLIYGANDAPQPDAMLAHVRALYGMDGTPEE